MNRIYTRTGDQGTTGIHGGTRVPKDDIRIEANGELDELNCHLGVIRSILTTDGWDDILHEIQRNLMTVMSLVATPAEERDKNPNSLPEDLVAKCEATMDVLTEESGPGLHFLLPGGTPLAAQLQLARAVCRRAERYVVQLMEEDEAYKNVQVLLNRLSDFFFILARFFHKKEKIFETVYQSAK